MINTKKQTANKGLDRLFTFSVKFAAYLTFIILIAIIVSLIIESIPSFNKFGFNFFISDSWSSPKEDFGALIPIYGTLVTSAIAIIIATPVSLFCAFFLCFLGPNCLKSILGIFIELLAAVPSIIFGMFGLIILAPYMSEYFQIPLQEILINIPFIGSLVDGSPIGLGLLPAGIVLGIMIIPYITSVIRDVFNQTPTLLKESAYGMGFTTWEVLWNIVVPFSRTGIISAVMLGLGRALGETMAVTFIIGNTYRLNSISLYEPGSTITSTIANEFAEADSLVHTSVLLELALVLFAITLIVLLLSKLIVKFLMRKDG